MNKENKKLVLFDFDGVLIDTFDICHAISSEVNENLSKEEYRSLFKGNIHEVLRADGSKKNAHPNFEDRFSSYTREIKVPQILKDILLELSKEYNLFIVSSTPDRSLENILSTEGVREYFTEILGSDSHKSKVAKNKMILDKYNLEPKDAVFITDTLGDIKEARECGVESIAVTWGFHDRKTLEKGNPIAIIENPQDLIGAIQNVLK